MDDLWHPYCKGRVKHFLLTLVWSGSRPDAKARQSLSNPNLTSRCFCARCYRGFQAGLILAALGQCVTLPGTGQAGSRSPTGAHPGHRTGSISDLYQGEPVTGTPPRADPQGSSYFHVPVFQLCLKPGVVFRIHLVEKML